MYMKNFNHYMLEVGLIKNTTVTFSDDYIHSEMGYFKECFEKELSPYKALLFLTLNKEE